MTSYGWQVVKLVIADFCMHVCMKIYTKILSMFNEVANVIRKQFKISIAFNIQICNMWTFLNKTTFTVKNLFV